MTQCVITGCAEHGRWTPILVLRPVPPGDAWKGASAALDLQLCDEHKNMTEISDFLSEKGWETIVDGFKKARKAPPSRDSVLLEFQDTAN